MQLIFDNFFPYACARAYVRHYDAPAPLASASQVENHGVDAPLMDEVKRFVYGHYEEHLEAKFYASALAMDLEAATRGDTDEKPSDEVDWESTYFIQHHPKTNVADFPEITPPTRSVYILLCCLRRFDLN